MAYLRPGTNPEFLYVVADMDGIQILCGRNTPITVNDKEFEELAMNFLQDDYDLDEAPIQVGDLELSQHSVPISELSWKKNGFSDEQKVIQIKLKKISTDEHVLMCPVTWECLSHRISIRRSKR